MRHLFPKTVSYNRFVELKRRAVVKLAVLVKQVLMGKCTGKSFIDSTPLRVCKNQRILQHKTFRGIAQIGKCSMGWFYGFKLHIVCNEMGGLQRDGSFAIKYDVNTCVSVRRGVICRVFFFEIFDVK